MFLEHVLEDLSRHWRPVFAQQRSASRALKLAIGLLLGMGRRTITRSLCFHGETEVDWSADYKIFSRSPWEEQALFGGIVPQLVGSGYLKTELAIYKEAKKKHNLSVAAVEQFRKMREEFDARGMTQTTLLHTVDGSYLNRTTLNYGFERSDPIRPEEN